LSFFKIYYYKLTVKIILVISTFESALAQFQNRDVALALGMKLCADFSIHVLNLVCDVRVFFLGMIIMINDSTTSLPYLHQEEFEDTKGQAEAVNRRTTSNTLAKRKTTKEQTMICRTLHRKLQIEQHEPH
jgi:hypothetical protein